MAINQLQLPSAQAFSGGLDFSPLGNLGQVYQKAQAQRGLQDALSGGINPSDPQSLAALAAKVLPNDPTMGMSLASLANTASNTQYQHGRDTTNDQWREQEAARSQGNTDRSYGLQANADARAAEAQRLVVQKQKDELAASADFRSSLMGLYGNGQQPPARAPVSSSPRVWGDKEAEAAGLYEPSSAAPSAQLAPASPVAGVAPTPTPTPTSAQAAVPTGVPVPQAPVPTVTTPQAAAQPDTASLMPGISPRALALMAAASSPRLPQGDREMAKTLLTTELDANKATGPIKEWAFAKAQDPATPPFTEWIRGNKSAGKTEVNVDTQGAGAFAKAAGGAVAKRFEDLSKEGDTGTTDLALIGQLRDLGSVVKTGTPTAIQGWLAQNGIKVGDNVGAVEAYGAIIDKLTPSQRIPGSGSTSDYEGAMFKRSLPNLLKTPEGNDIVQNTLAGLAQTKVDRARIAEQALAGELKPADALKQLRDLPNPYDNFKSFAKTGFRADPNNPDSVAKPGQQPTTAREVPMTKVETDQSLANARAAVQRNPAARSAIIQKLRDNGIDPSGL
jgi:hypothetical protein